MDARSFDFSEEDNLFRETVYFDKYNPNNTLTVQTREEEVEFAAEGSTFEGREVEFISVVLRRKDAIRLAQTILKQTEAE